MTIELIDISDRIKFLRESSHLSQAKFGKIINASAGNISDWERKRSKPGADALIAISKFFNVSTDWLLTGEGKGPTNTELDKQIEDAWSIENFTIDGKPVDVTKIMTPEKQPLLKVLWDGFIKGFKKDHKNTLDEKMIEKMIAEKGYAVIDIEKDLPELFKEIKAIEELQPTDNVYIAEIVDLLKKLPVSKLEEVKGFIEFQVSKVEEPKGGKSLISQHDEEAAGLDKAIG